LGDKVAEKERKQIEGKVEELKKAIQEENVERMKKLSEEVQNAFHALSQQLYAQGQTPPPSGEAQAGPESPPPPSDEGDVIDGEVRDA